MVRKQGQKKKKNRVRKAEKGPLENNTGFYDRVYHKNLIGGKQIENEISIRYNYSAKKALVKISLYKKRYNNT